MNVDPIAVAVIANSKPHLWRLPGLFEDPPPSGLIVDGTENL